MKKNLKFVSHAENVSLKSAQFSGIAHILITLFNLTAARFIALPCGEVPSLQLTGARNYISDLMGLLGKCLGKFIKSIITF